MTKEEIKNIYEDFFIRRKRVARQLVFDAYNTFSSRKRTPTNCVTCLIAMKTEFESFINNP
jgi:hypothetical protein